jgi:antitoxin (DNA-binding transcriptional repressor) of toxin-antitoxin stability system
MKAVNVREFKAHLSKYLRMASRGTRIVIKDRDEPVAEIGPLSGAALAWRDRLAQEGRLRRGSQDWGKLKLSRLDRRVDIPASLRAVRDDSHVLGFQ